jgi:vitamin B12/bleomycin/antimicrobial peptide transport system ATP-binding/permease protein
MERMDTVGKPPLSQPPDAPRLVLRSDSAIAQLMTLLRALIGSRRQLGLLALGVIVVICANAAGQIRLNIWQRDFYEAIEQRHMAGFITQLMVFVVTAGGLLVLVVSQTWLRYGCANG